MIASGLRIALADRLRAQCDEMCEFLSREEPRDETANRVHDRSIPELKKVRCRTSAWRRSTRFLPSLRHALRIAERKTTGRKTVFKRYGESWGLVAIQGIPLRSESSSMTLALLIFQAVAELATLQFLDRIFFASHILIAVFDDVFAWNVTNQ